MDTLAKNYIPYHVHTDNSLLDSCTKFKDYVDLAVKLGQRAICFTEHGNVYNWIEKKMYCDKVGVKYLHGVEIYLTEQLEPKVRDNYHSILIAKNEAGLKEINTLIDLSTHESHRYYKPRISFDEFLGISDNVIKISACLASPLRKLEENHPYFHRLAQSYDFYEVQLHDIEHQRVYNEKLYQLSKVYHKPLIVGTDFHNLNAYKGECRSILQKAKKIEFSSEDTFDLCYKSYDELIEMVHAQKGTVPFLVMVEALDCTNRLYDLTEEIVLDLSFKYPKLSDDDEAALEKRVFEMCKDKIARKVIEPDKEYLVRIEEELRVFKKIGMCSFMLFMSELCVWCRENTIPFGFCRGSVGGSTIAYLLDIIDVNPVRWQTVFSRFANEDRIEVGDIDLDYGPKDRQKVFDYIINRFGKDYACYILAMTTIADKGTIDDIGRALDYMWQEEHPNQSKYESPYSLERVVEIKKAFEMNPIQARKAYSELFYYFDGLVGTTIAQSMHPAGIVVAPLTLYDNYGTFYDKEGNRIMQINMEEIHEVSLVKYDILGLKNIGIISDTYKSLNLPYPLSHEVDWEDGAVWDDIITSPVGIFQFEGNHAFRLLKQYKPQVINDLSIVNAALRPSGESYRDQLVQKIVNVNPSEQIDTLLAPNNGYLVFQEDVIKFLTDICGMSGSEADNTRRAIGRKDVVRLEKALPTILEGYCSKSDKERGVAEVEARTFLQIIEDSSNYMFGYNHSTGYSMIGYLCGYLRYYYPVNFVAAYLNNAGNSEDIVDGTALAKLKGITIYPPRFGYSKGTYTPDSENHAIYKGIGSIKFCNVCIGEELFALKDKGYKDFVALLVAIAENTSVDHRQMSILIKLGFFVDFGKTKYLQEIHQYFMKQYKKTHKEATKVKRIESVSTYATSVENVDLPLQELIDAQLEYVGYIDYKDTSFKKDVVCVSSVKKTKWSTFVSLYRLRDGVEANVKVDSRFIKEHPLRLGNPIKVIDLVHKHRMKKNEEGKFVTLDEKEFVLMKYAMIVD